MIMIAILGWIIFALVTSGLSVSGLSLYWGHRALVARRRILDRYDTPHR